MPVSRTVNEIVSEASAKTRSETEPRSVNLIAFDSRLLRICPSRCGSVSMRSGVPGSIRAVSARPFSRAIGAMVSSSASTVLATRTGRGSTCIVPASIFERSRMSLISARRSWPVEGIVCA